MRFVSPLMKSLIYPALSRSGCLRRLSAAVPVVVTYHGVFPAEYSPSDELIDGNLITQQVFISQLQFLKSKYNLITPQQFRNWGKGELELAPRSVLLTCDDGLLNNITEMLPAILGEGLSFLFFVTANSASSEHKMLWHERINIWLKTCAKGIADRQLRSRQPHVSSLRATMLHLSAYDAVAREERLAELRTQLGISEKWDSQYSENEALRKRFYMLNVNELRALRDAGMTIGAHSLSHPMLSQMPTGAAFREAEESRTQLEQALGESVWAFAYPFGNSEAVSAREPELARRAGFEFAFMNVEESSGQFSFPRVHISRGMSLAELDAHVCGLHSKVRQTFTRAACA